MFSKSVQDVLRGPLYEPLLCLVAAAFGWFGVGTIAKWAAGAKARGVVAAVRFASAVAVTAVVFRIFAHHDAPWFGLFGDYFHPVLTMLSLLGLAAALYYQRLELREAQRQSTYARHRRDEEVRRHRLSDASFVFINEVRFVAGEYRLSIVCGGTSIAMNVFVSVAFGAGDGVSASVSLAVMLPDDRVERTIRPTMTEEIGHPKTIRVFVRWLNVHSMQLSYEARMTPTGDGFWNAPERVERFVASPGSDEDFVLPGGFSPKA